MEAIKTGVAPQTRLTKKLKDVRTTFVKNRFLLWISMPMLLFTIVFSYLPMFGVVVAFKRYKFNEGIFGSEWIGLSNFNFLMQSPDLWRIVRNTLGYNSMFIVLNLIAAVIVALLLFEITSKKWLKFYQTVMFFPYFLSWVVVAFMAYAFLNPRSGMLNQLFQLIGWNTIDWYTEAAPWLAIFPIANLWKEIGFSAIIYYAALLGIDSSYFEAAKMDGASRWHVMTRISLPFLYPVIAILTILAVGNIFDADFGLFYQLPMNSPVIYSTTDVIDTFIYRALTVMGNIGVSSAVGLVKSVVGLLLVVTVNWIVRRMNPDNALF